MSFFKKYSFVLIPLIIVLMFLTPYAIEALTSKYKAIRIEAITGMILNGVEIGDWEETAGFKTKVSSDDTTENFLLQKMIGSSNISLTETNGGSNETLVVDIVPSAVGTSELTDNGVTLAKLADGTANRAFVTNGSGDPALEPLDFDVMQTQTQGDILIYGSGGVPNDLSPGTSGQFLRTNGSFANASWADVGANCEFFSGSGLWIRRSSITQAYVTAVGGGGGGGGNGIADGSGGGGGAGYIESIVSVFSSISVTIGSAGSGGSPQGTGGSGGTTSFGSIVTANGGSGGASGASQIGGIGGSGGSSSTTGTALHQRNGSRGSDGIAGVAGNGGAGGGVKGSVGGAGGSGTSGGVGSAAGEGGGGSDDFGTFGGAGKKGYIIVCEMA